MKFTKIFFFLALSFVVVFSSCRKDEFSEEIKTEEEVKVETSSDNKLVYSITDNDDGDDELDLGCFVINLPFGLLIDGVEYTINTEDDFETVLNNGGEFIDFVYPLNVTYLDQTTGQIADGEALGEAFASCVPDDGWGNDDFPAYLICDLNSCYQLVYPVNLVDGDGNVFTANNEDEFINLIIDQPELYFEFPISLTDTDGNIVSANSEEDIYQLLSDCDNFNNPVDSIYTDGADFGCYNFVYPFNLLDTDGNTVTVNNIDEFFNALFNGDIVGFDFPISLQAADSTIIVVNNEADFDAALYDCGDFGPTPDILDVFTFIINSSVFQGDCYELVYPFTISNQDGTQSMTINDATEANDLVLNPAEFYSVDLPVNIILLDTGVTVEVTEVGQLFQILEDCN